MQLSKSDAHTTAATTRAKPSLTAAPENSDIVGSPICASAAHSPAAAIAAATHAWDRRSGAGSGGGAPGFWCRAASAGEVSGPPPRPTVPPLPAPQNEPLDAHHRPAPA